MFLGASDSGGPSKPTFSVGMKLEAVDRRFPYFVCVATIMDRTGTLSVDKSQNLIFFFVVHTFIYKVYLY
jgi:hypothetical protein